MPRSNHLALPEMRVHAVAIPPPVHDSAVTRSSPRFFNARPALRASAVTSSRSFGFPRPPAIPVEIFLHEAELGVEAACGDVVFLHLQIGVAGAEFPRMAQKAH